MKNIATLALLGFLTAFRSAAPSHPGQIFLVGDSTMSEKPDLSKPERGWGMMLGKYLDKEVIIRNHAVNGRSTKSFLGEGRWRKVLEQVKPGDWVLIQLGHNDAKAEDTTRSAPAQTVYRQLLTRYVQEARQKGARPVLLTPVGRRSFDEQGQLKDDPGDYPGVARAVAAQQKVPLIDLHKSSRKLYAQLGDEGTKPLFWSYRNGYFTPNPVPPQKNDNTHFSANGADRVAALVARGVDEQKLRLAEHLQSAKVNCPELPSSAEKGTLWPQAKAGVVDGRPRRLGPISPSCRAKSRHLAC